MERLRNLFRQAEFPYILFLFSGLLFGWPLVSFSNVQRLVEMFAYLFIAWAVIIGLLFLLTRDLTSGDGPVSRPDPE